MQPQNIWAVGRNYADHAKELGHAVPTATGEPLIFLKAGSSRVENGGVIHLPDWSRDIHYETEVALRFGRERTITDFTIALDLTARDVQAKLKSQGHPWTLAKSFKDSCPLGDFVSAKGIDLGQLEFILEINGERRQKARTNQMIFQIPQLVDYVVSRFPVLEGDVLLTGTPAGVAQLHAGDEIRAEIIGNVAAHWQVARANVVELIKKSY